MWWIIPLLMLVIVLAWYATIPPTGIPPQIRTAAGRRVFRQVLEAQGPHPYALECALARDQIETCTPDTPEHIRAAVMHRYVRLRNARRERRDLFCPTAFPNDRRTSTPKGAA